MSYANLIPSITEYAEKFRELDSLDLKLIGALCAHDVRNVSRLSRIIGVPQQTLSYRVNRFDEKNLVRFRALLSENKLGLKSFLVVASCGLGKEEVSGRALTCFPLWKYLAIVEGAVRGNYVRYLIPPEKEGDLKAFLDELVRRRFVLDYKLMATTSPEYPLLNLDFYGKAKGTSVFDWQKWVGDLDSFPEEAVSEPVNYKKASFDLYDLIILRCLEINARMKLRDVVNQMAMILNEKNRARLIPLVSRRLKKNIIPQKLVRGYRVYVLPSTGQNLLFIIYHLSFATASAMEEFVGGLSFLPYNVTWLKLLRRNELFVHFAIPAYEYPGMRKALMRLGEKGCLKSVRPFFGDLTNATWGNVEIYQMFRDGSWDFSYGRALEMLKKTFHEKS